jgi:putative transposase
LPHGIRGFCLPSESPSLLARSATGAFSALAISGSALQCRAHRDTGTKCSSTRFERPTGKSGIDDVQYDPDRHHRRSIRLHGYEYSRAGAYFITVCTRGRQCILGDVVDGEMSLNKAGRAVQAAWRDLPNHYPHIELDAFVVMPNHVHAIIVLVDETGHADVGAGFSLNGTGRSSQAPQRCQGDSVCVGKPAPTPKASRRHGLPEIVRGFKTFAARCINRMRGTPGRPVWQRNYYEHIIRNDREWNAVRLYIRDNPQHWDLDRENPHAIHVGGKPGRRTRDRQ